ncbi:hypothetical protein JVT61DRAFT_13380 [Boletus reticuloceps]|uniref:Uncharacterized protein n=1 Tax=Boletus reticuloceps TaxID=495285 RepID=A0A8I2YDL8_9AGAM|nr:hypothetical protein JVT61DRAFT_13380 [Boletus reticuloceps]
MAEIHDQFDTIQSILILDFESQYSHLITRRCRELKVYAELTLLKDMHFKPQGMLGHVFRQPAAKYSLANFPQASFSQDHRTRCMIPTRHMQIKLMHEAIGDRFHAIMVDNGVLRLNEAKQVHEMLNKDLGVNLTVVDAFDLFLSPLRVRHLPPTSRSKMFPQLRRASWRQSSRVRVLQHPPPPAGEPARERGDVHVPNDIHLEGQRS